MLVLCGSMHAQQYQMDIEMTDGSTVSYPMTEVQDVTYDNRNTIVNLRGQETFTMVIYKNEDIKSITWTECNGEAMATEPSSAAMSSGPRWRSERVQQHAEPHYLERQHHR